MPISGSGDTIAAIATPLGESGIGIVRLSGNKALTIADRVFIAKDGMRPSSCRGYTVRYGWVAHSAGTARKAPREDGLRHDTGEQGIIDEVLLTVMRAPRSYTKEDVVEINCHGGIVALRAVLERTLEEGARLAEPGEFTQRAFLNGRIDLTQAEAVCDIIRAKTDAALRLGTEQLKGTLSRHVADIRRGLVETLAAIEAAIDFPEEESGRAETASWKKGLSESRNGLKRLCDTAAFGRLMREGVRIVICGRPNVGKSSLLNALLKVERAIVTPVAGTTRDVIEEVMSIKGIPVRIADTAGIIEPRDLIERKAVQRSKQQIKLADVVIAVFDAHERLTPADRYLMSRLKGKRVVAVANKSDLKARIERGAIERCFGGIVELSARTGTNIAALEEGIVRFVCTATPGSGESTVAVSARHGALLRAAEKSVAAAIRSLDNEISVELIAQDLREALVPLDELSGARFSEDCLTRIFSEFCIGK